MAKLWHNFEISSEAFDKVFAVIDINGSGTIDRDEMAEFFRQLALLEDNLEEKLLAKQNQSEGEQKINKMKKSKVVDEIAASSGKEEQKESSRPDE